MLILIQNSSKDFYNGSQQLEFQMCPEKSVIEYQYDDNAKLITAIEYYHRLSKLPNSNQELRQLLQDSPYDNKLSLSFNVTGDKAFSIDSMGRIIQYQLNAKHQVLHKTCYNLIPTIEGARHKLCFVELSKLIQTHQQDQHAHWIYLDQAGSYIAVDNKGQIHFQEKHKASLILPKATEISPTEPHEVIVKQIKIHYTTLFTSRPTKPIAKLDFADLIFKTQGPTL